jgi:hypothetical protein
MRLFAIVVLVAYSVLRPGSVAAASQDDDAAFQWAYQHYANVLDQVFPLPSAVTRPFPDDTEWLLAARMSPSFEREMLLRIKKPFKGPVTIDLTVAERPLRKQLEDARRLHPDWSMEQIVQSLSIRRETKLASACPRLVELAGLLPKQRMSPVPTAMIYVDGTSYDLVIEASTGRVVYSLEGPGTTSAPDPIVKWAEQARRAAEACQK